MSQKLVEQSDETAGLRARNWERVREYCVATVEQVSPDVIRCHLLQFGGWPVWVGPGGPEVVVVLLGDDEVVLVDGEV